MLVQVAVRYPKQKECSHSSMRTNDGAASEKGREAVISFPSFYAMADFNFMRYNHFRLLFQKQFNDKYKTVRLNRRQIENQIILISPLFFGRKMVDFPFREKHLAAVM